MAPRQSIYLVAYWIQGVRQSLHHYPTVELTLPRECWRQLASQENDVQAIIWSSWEHIIRSLTPKSSGNCQKGGLFDRTSLKDFLQSLGHSPLRRRAVWQWQYQAQPTSHSPFSRCGDCAIVPRQVHKNIRIRDNSLPTCMGMINHFTPNLIC